MDKLEITVADGSARPRIESDHIGPHHAYGKLDKDGTGIVHISFSAPSFILRDRGKEWCVEWHRYFGPSVVRKDNGDYAKRQPSEKSRFWHVAQWWHDQGGKVVDGVGVWVEPKIIEKRYSRLNRNKIVEDVKGDIVLRYYEGYEQWGPI